MHGRRLKNLAFMGFVLAILAGLVAQGIYLYRRMDAYRDSAVERQLSEVAAQFDGAMERRYETVDAVAKDAAALFAGGSSREALTDYFYQKTDEMAEQTDGECMSVYCTNGDWQIMKDFHPDENYSVQERLWYAGALQGQGRIYISSPYVDYRTGQCLYSLSRMVDESRTVCIDYSLSGLQQILDDAAADLAGEYMLTDRNGMIYACFDAGYAGMSVKSLSGYYDAVRRAFSFPGRTLRQNINGRSVRIYSKRLKSGLYLIAFADDTVSALLSAQKVTELLLPAAVFLGLVAVLAAALVRYHRWRKKQKEDAAQDEIFKISVRQNRYLAFLLLVFLGVFAFFINKGFMSRFDLERESMKNGRENFRGIVSQWYGDVQNVLTCIDYNMKYVGRANADVPSVSAFLGNILEGSDVISNIYVYNPTWDVPLVDALETAGDIAGIENAYSGAIGLNGDYYITFPYVNDQYGVYCVTVSKAVYDRDGNFVCVAGVDCFLDKLINILSTADTEEGYAFLVDNETNIINHPYAAYQMRTDRVSRASELSYASAFLTDGMVSVKDYDNVRRFCMVTADEETGFYIVVMRSQENFRAELIRTLAVYLAVIVTGVAVVIVSMRSLARWQITAVRRLSDAAVLANQSSQAKSDFLANMSHEIRTPMNAIVGMCEMILREPDISAPVQKYGYHIQNAGRNLLSIINDILDFSKIEAGKIELIEEEFNIASTLNDVINMAVARKMDKKLEILVHVDPDIPAGLIGDEPRIRQVIINLVTNGIKYTDQGCVVITVSQTKQEYGINLAVSVRDTGIGITEENLEKLFSSFAQVDTKRNRSVEGTGLGLAISKRLITQMGGFINVSSVYEEGSEFRFVIPLAVSDPAPFIRVGNPEAIHAAGYFVGDKFDSPVIASEYMAVIGEMRDWLHVDVSLPASFEELRENAEAGRYTHIYVGREEYLGQREVFDALAKEYEVVVVQERTDAVTLSSDVKCLFKPFYLLSAAAVFNNESVVISMSSGKEYAENFIAPGARVLVVDDNAVNLQVAVGLMRPYRMQVLTADDAKKAFEMLGGMDIDIVFMDHMMPEIDGVEATKIIREMEGDYYKQLPIIALTANAVSGVKNLFLDAGMNDFIAKPIEVSTLGRVLKTWLPKELIEKKQESGKDVSPSGEAAELEEGTELFSVKRGVFYTGGDVESYYQILATYIEKGEGEPERIRQLYKEESWKDYVTRVHALKSASLSIGSKQLSEAAAELEQAGKAGDYETIRGKNEALLELYKEVLEIGAQKLAAWRAEREAALGREAQEDCGKTEELREILAEELSDYRERMRAAADAFDADELSAACEELSACIFGGVSLAERFEDVKKAAGDFECEQAGELAEQAFEELLGKQSV